MDVTLLTEDDENVKVYVTNGMFPLGKKYGHLEERYYSPNIEIFDNEESDGDFDTSNWCLAFCFSANNIPIVAYRDMKGYYSFYKASPDIIEETKDVEPEPIWCDLLEDFGCHVFLNQEYWSELFTTTVREDV